MSDTVHRIDVCPECRKLRDDSSEKELFQCPSCERWFCERHVKPRLAVFKDLNMLIKDKDWRERVEEDWKREDGHPDYAYTEERFDELKIEKEILRSKIEGFLDKSRAYRRTAPREQSEVYENPPPTVETSTSKRLASESTRKLWSYFRVSPNFVKVGLLIFVILLLEYLFLRAYFNSTIYVFVALGALYLIYKLFIMSSRIQVTSDLRLWGLRILSGLVFLVGLLLLVGAFMSYAFSAFTPEKLDNPAYTSVFVFFGVFGLGLMLLSSYLMFRFTLKSGVIVYQR